MSLELPFYSPYSLPRQATRLTPNSQHGRMRHVKDAMLIKKGDIITLMSGVYLINDSYIYGRGVMEATEKRVELLNRNMLHRCGQTVFGSTAAVVQNTKRLKQKTS